MTAKDMTDDELLELMGQIYGDQGLVAELIRRYREATTRRDPGDTFQAGWDAVRLEVWP
jgi:hypothetical protein